ncbi:uncharacterized protein LOC110105486 [Dendrobium catenatum]|uniref:Amine oxidase domain-containing protein n=1 Tax=Dendrobium catenatum TaxID=906689 RepID=A0A2I0WUA3_9ASPA|nr:uncharacterized protein LOC110105486 [Dendrobium catenatum]PKU79239.1 hypothetical protein MA16_Dca000583 [Dendrobium catenatum]
MTAAGSAFSLLLESLNVCPPFLHKTPKLRRTLSAVCAAKERYMDAETMNPSRPIKRPNRRKPSSYGTSRRSAMKKSFSQEQVYFTTPVSHNPSIAIIGGGLSGLLCAATLEERGIRSTVFDTGIHGLGGRMATRAVVESQQKLVFDHAAQFFTACDARFQNLVNRWVSEGLVLEWKGTIGELEAGGRFTPIQSSTTKYIGIDGMRPLADSIHKGTNLVEITRPCWISKLEPCNGMWHLSENEKNRGSFDAIVIAHNGKCANRLLSSSGLPQLFRQMKKLELSSIWALLAAFEDPLPVPFEGDFNALEGAFVKNIESVSWMCNNTSKLFPLQSSNGAHQCWTFFSTASYGRRNKVPQENIPNVTAEKVKTEMLDGVEAALGLSKGSLPEPFYTRVQLWGAALPINTPGVPCIFDPYGRAGICGDWLLGSSMEAAALSGISLGNHMADFFQGGGIHLEEFAVGLHEGFKAVSGYDIGHFPGLDSDKQVICDFECVA